MPGRKPSTNPNQLDFDFQEEQWTPVVGFELFYRVTDFGQVGRVNGKILKPGLSPRGYLTVSLYNGKGKSRTMKVHKLVAEAFLGPRPPGKEVNHKNGIKTDNRVSNLEYVSSGDNQRHAYRIGLRTASPRKGEQHWKHKLTSEDIKEIRSLKGAMTQRAIARKFNVSEPHISLIMNGKAWQHLAD
jgi:hypothetical protein